MNSTWEHVGDGKITLGAWEHVGDDATTLKNMMLEKLRPLYEVSNEQDRQERLRERYPALQAAYENYLMVLRMVENEIDPTSSEDTELA